MKYDFDEKQKVVRFMKEKIFRSGRNAGFGRKAGVSNRVPRVVKEAILLAIEQAGNEIDPNYPFAGMVVYLKKIAIERPVLFMSLLARILPLQIGECKLRSIQVLNSRE